MKKNHQPKIIAGLGVGVIIVLAWLAQPTARQANPSLGSGQVAGQAVSGALVAESASYDFGSISMAAGKVKKVFTVKNTAAESITISKLYTSCMCTTASLQTAGGSFGPFGMPGHGFIPGIKATIAPGETAQVEVVFDPAAHGPAGVGRIDRLISLESPGAAPLQLAVSATVTP